MAKSIWYSLADDLDCKYELTTDLRSNLNNPDNAWMIADEVGDDYWSNHDGFEVAWPLQFAIFENEGDVNPLYCIEVSAEPSIEFSGDICKAPAEVSDA